MELKEKIGEIVEKLKEDPRLLARFKEDPVKAVEEAVGIDLPDEQLRPLVAGIRAKLGADDVSDALGKLGKLF